MGLSLSLRKLATGYCDRAAPLASYCTLIVALTGCATYSPEDIDLDADWVARSNAPGVTISHRFDSASEVTRYRLGDKLEDHVTWETTLKKSGAGALRININKEDHSNSGSWRRFLKPDGSSFGPGDEFYVQYRVYITKEMVNAYRHSNGDGWKVSIISRADDIYPGSVGSNWFFEVVVYNQYYKGDVFGYNRGSPDYNGWEYPRWQKWPADDWLTILQHISVGELSDGYYRNTRIRTWAARDGKKYKLLIDHKRDVGYQKKQPSINDVYNGVWLLPYDTHREGSDVDTFIVYDEIIVSTDFIPAPGFLTQ